MKEFSLVARRCYNKPVQGITSVDVWQNRIFVFGALRWRWQFPEQDSQTPTEGFVMSKEIPLTRGFVAIVDEEDYEYLMQWKWAGNVYGYASRQTTPVPFKKVSLRMHRVIMERMLGGPIPKGLWVDHIDGNPGNNQRNNLRLATRQQNRMNSKANRDTSSRFKGVSRIPVRSGKGNPWRACIQINRHLNHIGVYPTEEDAARAYDKEARRLFGEFAYLNFPDE